MGNESLHLNTEPTPVSKTQLTHLGALTLMQAQNQYCLLKTYSYSDPYLM